MVQLCVIQLLTIWTFANTTVCFASECWGGKSEGWRFDCDTPFDDLDVFTLCSLLLPIDGEGWQNCSLLAGTTVFSGFYIGSAYFVLYLYWTSLGFFFFLTLDFLFVPGR